jgi:hypothetical protein
VQLVKKKEHRRQKERFEGTEVEVAATRESEGESTVTQNSLIE